MSDTPFSLASSNIYSFQRIDQAAPIETSLLVEEIPLAISINNINHAVMMVTPVNLDAFALGFALSEGLIKQASDVRDMTIQANQSTSGISGLAINLEISARQFNQFKQSQKARLGATGCGLCGIESLEQAFPALGTLPDHEPLIEDSLKTLRASFFEHQVIGQQSGAIHGALLISSKGDILICMEDIGRHNALDKVIGYALQQQIPLHNHHVVMSSRCSAELVQKAIRAKLSGLIHLASPSTLAVELARQYKLSLIHLPKQDTPRIYAATAQP
ncbi:formate dehydrogenase accessory sulfurtransferase FdhD [Marinomonas transparens]|uniref:Sulfur carrier protein FdhD n=1 Tax=Marinomonas transparens TaxID=2795388 RepID=A0A934JUJ9_9GAMM|nr:formate dehydrogenase accessory sulfurtransferase FdhD [Marinomonas transparens]MBJ7538562.1 formate dehydrogenase accessory sulfurtransferase FdhD [Marinomonas transparens]